MRIGEILGLRGEYVYDKYIKVCGQYTKHGYGKTKNKENRNIPLLPEMIALLRSLMEKNGKGYVFSLDCGAKPVNRNYVYCALKDALRKIGINDEEIQRRGLSVHGWRHFLNTDLLRQGLTIQQVQGVTGHKSDDMTERYNHLDVRLIDDVIKAQAAIVGEESNDLNPVLCNKTSTPNHTDETAAGTMPAFTLVKTQRRKQRNA